MISFLAVPNLEHLSGVVDRHVVHGFLVRRFSRKQRYTRPLVQRGRFDRVLYKSTQSHRKIKQQTAGHVVFRQRFWACEVAEGKQSLKDITMDLAAGRPRSVDSWQGELLF